MDITVDVHPRPGESRDAIYNAEETLEFDNNFIEKVEHMNLYPFKEENVEGKPTEADQILIENTSDEEFASTSEVEYIKVFISRDYSESRFIRFNNTFPKILEGKIEKETFEETINKLNNYFEEPENFSWYTCSEGCLACFTAHLVYIFKQTPYEKCLKKVSEFVAEQNISLFEPKGLKLVDPSLRGLRVLEISSLKTHK